MAAFLISFVDYSSRTNSGRNMVFNHNNQFRLKGLPFWICHTIFNMVVASYLKRVSRQNSSLVKNGQIMDVLNDFY